MTHVSGYGETPSEPLPVTEQPAWLREVLDQPAAGTSARHTGPAYRDASGAPMAPGPLVTQAGYPQGYLPPGHPQPYPPGHPAAYGAGYPAAPWGPYARPPRSRLAAGLLGIFGGALGLHRFYLGHVGVGMTMLLITVLSFGLLSAVTIVWGVVEGILYLSSRTGRYSRDATERPLRG